MDLKLLDLRRYAIDRRVEIKFSDPDSGHQCLINNKGQVKIPSGDRDFRVEDVLATSEGFEVIENSKSLRLTRQEMLGAVSEAFNKRVTAVSVKEEE